MLIDGMPVGPQLVNSSVMKAFTEREIEYLKGQRLARLATLGAGASPHVVPVGFRVSEDGDAIEVGGHGFRRSKKYRDMQANARVAIVVDDLASVNPWTPRGIEVRGLAELQDSGGTAKFGPGWDEAWVRIVPQRVNSWGIEAAPFTEGSRSGRSIPQA
jgi:pyridoxamine 5'-phosphate oxidase family protein